MVAHVVFISATFPVSSVGVGPIVDVHIDTPVFSDLLRTQISTLNFRHVEKYWQIDDLAFLLSG